MNPEPIVIAGAARTPIGRFRGALAGHPAPALGGAAIRAALQRARVAGDAVGEVLMGCVLPAGLGQAPARQASLAAGIPQQVGCTTVNKVCGSGMKALMLGHDLIRAGSARIVVAGGMESMSNAPYLLPEARGGYRLGHGRVLDHMFLDGLEDAYDPGRLMGTFAEDCARRFGIDRAAQDAFAAQSLRRAQRAIASGAFGAEVDPLAGGGGAPVARDEGPPSADPARIPTLRPAFREGGTITAANASSIADGAAALVLLAEGEAERRGLEPLARIAGHASHARAPAEFAVAPIHAIRRLLEGLGWRRDSVGLWEINEAFAVVVLAALGELGLDPERVNVHGGACALGHPIGASGARIVVTLLYAMRHLGAERGVASLCIGGGEATALALERIP